MRTLAEISCGYRESNDSGVVETAIFIVFAGYFSETEMRPALLDSEKQSVVSFSVIPKCVTLNDLEWLFALNSVFVPVNRLIV